MTLLPVQPAHALPQLAEDRRWLIDGLWGDQAVGIVGGEPKCCQSFLALDLAVAVAAGVPCLRRFPAARRGRVLLFAAEDALHIVRARLEGICGAGGISLAELDVHVITAPSVRLDLVADQDRLTATIAALRPALLILDPFVRLHRIDENASADVAPLLAYLPTSSAATRSRSSSSITPVKGPAACATGRRCGGARSFTRGATPTFTCGATTST
jgi:RecA-family ATPase